MDRSGFNTDPIECPVSATTVLETSSGKGKAGNLLERLVISVAISATSLVTIQDGGGGAIEIVPANTPIGPYSIKVGARAAAGAWSLTTLAGSTVLAVGDFTSQS